MSWINDVIEVKEEYVGLRLDRFIAIHCKKLNFIIIQKLLRTGQIRLDGKKVIGAKRVLLGSQVRIPRIYRNNNKNKYEVYKPLNKFWQNFINKNIIYRDKEILAINKPSGIAVQGGSKIKNHIDEKLDYLRFDSPYRPQLLHRLDKETTGVLILSRNPATTKRLGSEFRNRNIKKTYWALVIGYMPKRNGSINVPLEKVSNKGYELTSFKSKGKESKTKYNVLWKGLYKGVKLSLVEFNPETGRKHQIRAHCAELGCYIYGDKKYNLGKSNNLILEKDFPLEMQLHARQINLPDEEGITTSIVAPIPEHMKIIFKLLQLDKYIPD